MGAGRAGDGGSVRAGDAQITLFKRARAWYHGVVKNDIYRSRHVNPPQLDEAGLIEYFKTQPDIAAAYLFGSMATGKATVNSDVDIAVLMVDVPDDVMRFMERETQLSEDIHPFVDREFDLIILNHASLTFCQEVLAKGRFLYEGDRPIRIEFQVKVAREYADMKPVYDFFTRAHLEAAREGRFGKPGSHRISPTQVPAR